MAVNRYYSSTAQETTLSGGISNSATSMTVGGVTGFPVSFPYTLIIDRGTASEEVVTVTNAAGTSLTVTRAVDGTSGVSHSAGATVVHGVSARDHREAQEHIAATGAVHGLSGSIVGTTDTQTLTNKTLTSPAVTTPTITSGGSWGGSPTLTSPTIADFTNAAHDHGDADDGGAIPQASVTGLVSALGTLTTDIAALDTRLDSAEPTISSHTTSISTLSNPASAILGHNADQTINNNTDTALSFNTEEDDTHGGHSTVTNNSRYTFPGAGWYHVVGIVPWTASAASGKLEAFFRINGSIHRGGTAVDKGTQVLTFTNNLSRTLRITGASDYIELMVFQFTGASRTTDSGYKGGCGLHIHWIRPL